MRVKTSNHGQAIIYKKPECVQQLSFLGAQGSVKKRTSEIFGEEVRETRA